MHGSIIITATQRDGVYVPADGPMAHALDGIRGASRKALDKAIERRVASVEPGVDEVHVVYADGETVLHMRPAVR